MLGLSIILSFLFVIIMFSLSSKTEKCKKLEDENSLLSHENKDLKIKNASLQKEVESLSRFKHILDAESEAKSILVEAKIKAEKIMSLTKDIAKKESSINTKAFTELRSELASFDSSQPVEVFFKDNWYSNQTDFSYFSPSEARRELKIRQEDGEWIPEEDYYGLINAIASGKDEQYMAKISLMTPEETEKWFESNRNRGTHMSTEVWKAVAAKVAPIHEDYLIEKMRTKTSNTIEPFVRNRKQEGYFFSNRAYRLANIIYSGAFDDKTKRAELKNLSRW